MQVFEGRKKSALETMAALAKHYKDGPYNVADISVDREYSISYLEQLFASLRDAGLVVGVRGPGGGYMLAKPPDRISIEDVLQAMGKGEPSNGLTALENELREPLRKFTLDRLVQ